MIEDGVGPGSDRRQRFVQHRVQSHARTWRTSSGDPRRRDDQHGHSPRRHVPVLARTDRAGDGLRAPRGADRRGDRRRDLDPVRVRVGSPRLSRQGFVVANRTNLLAVHGTDAQVWTESDGSQLFLQKKGEAERAPVPLQPRLDRRRAGRVRAMREGRHTAGGGRRGGHRQRGRPAGHRRIGQRRRPVSSSAETSRPLPPGGTGGTATRSTDERLHERGARRDADRLGRPDRRGRRSGAARRRLPAGGRRQVSGDPVLRPVREVLHFEDLYTDQWRRMVDQHPDVPAGSTNKYQNWEVVDPEKWVPDGYACVRVDSRGAGRSPGLLDLWSAREAKDLYDCIEWAAEPSRGSNGKVGLNGISYYAMNQWQVAALQPPHLTAICIWEGAADYYRDLSHHGGILCTFGRAWFPGQVIRVQHGMGTRGYRSRMNGDWVAGPETLTPEELGANRRDFYEDCWRTRSPPTRYWHSRMPDWSKVTVPLLLGRQLGRAGSAPARQLRGLRPRRLRAEVARGPRHRALDPLLHRLRRRPAEEVLRPLPQGRGHGLDETAEGRAPGAASGRDGSSSGTRTNGRWRGRDGRSST